MMSAQSIITKPKRYNPLAFWFHSHIRAALSSLGALMRTPVTSLMTILVFAIAMALPISFLSLLHSVAPMQLQWQQPKLTLYLKNGLDVNVQTQLMQQLQQNPEFSTVDYISPQQGLAQLTEQANLPSMVLQEANNPLPGVIVLSLKQALTEPKALQALQQQLSQLNGVDSVQVNLQWLERLYYVVTLLHRLSLGLAGLLAVGLFFVTANTIRLVLQNHRPEVRLLKLIGATKAFIRRPLLYRGLWLSMGGAFCAWILVFVLMDWLTGPLAKFTQSYGVSIYAQFYDFKLILASCLVAAAIGLTAAWFVAARYLRQREEGV